MLKQMGRFSSKYGRYIFFTFLVLVCVGLFLPTASIECNGNGRHGDEAGTIFGEKVSHAEFEDTRARWSGSRRLLGNFHKTQNVIRVVMMMGGTEQDYMKWYSFLLGQPSEDEVTDFTWRVLTLLHEARQAGIVVSDAEVIDFVQDLFGGPKFDRALYLEKVRDMTRLSVDGFERTVRDALVIDRFFRILQDGATGSTEDVYKAYLEQNEKAQVRYAKFEASAYEDRVSLAPTRQAIRPADERRRAVVIDGDSIFAQYLREKGPLTVDPRVRLEYAFAEYDAFLAGVTPPTEPQMRERYETSKEQYRIHTADKVYKPLDEVKADIRKALLDAEKDHPEKVTDEAVAAQYEKDKQKYLIKDEDQRYKPFEEVKGEIQKALEKDQAAEKAYDKLRELQEDIELARYADEHAKIDLAAQAAKHGVAHGTTGLVDEHHLDAVEKALGKSQDLERILQSADSFEAGTVLQRMDTEKGAFVAMISEKVGSFVPPMTVPIRRKLALQLVHRTAQRLAFEAAREFHGEARKRIDNAIEEWSKAHPNTPQEEREKALQALRRDVLEGLVTERGLSFETPSPITRQDRALAEVFDRPRYEVELLPPGTAQLMGEPEQYQDVYRIAQLVERYQPDGKDFEGQKARLGEQIEKRKQNDFLEKYLTEVWTAAKVEDKTRAKPREEKPPLDDNP